MVKAALASAYTIVSFVATTDAVTDAPAATAIGLILPPVAVAVTAVAAVTVVLRTLIAVGVAAVTTRLTSAKIGYCIELDIAVAVTAIAAGTTICV